MGIFLPMVLMSTATPMVVLVYLAVRQPLARPRRCCAFPCLFLELQWGSLELSATLLLEVLCIVNLERMSLVVVACIVVEALEPCLAGLVDWCAAPQEVPALSPRRALHPLDL